MVGHLLLSLALAGASFGPPPTLQSGPVISGGAVVNPFAGPLFEVAPPGGAGLDGTMCNCNSTNLTTFPQDFDNAAWTKQGVTSAAPVVTPNYAQDPTGAFGAERVQVDACAGANTGSIVYQIGLTGAATTTASVYCRATAGASQQISICAYDGTGPTGTCTPITCTSTAWTRFSVSRVSAGVSGIVLGCNNLSAYTGSSNTGVADVLLFGGNDTVSASVQPYVVIPETNVGGTGVISRASAATCLKTIGVAPQAIANGDMVTCATGQIRVMPGTDGQPDGGILAEAGRTNNLLRSQEFDNGAWSLENSGGGIVNPVVTANQATSPDNTPTADRIQIQATSGSQYSAVFQQPAALGITSSSVLLRGNASSGSTDLCQWNGSAHTCVTCTFVPTAWTLCKNENVNGGASSVWTLGNVSALNGGIARAAVDFFAFGGEWDVGSYVSSYIATAGATVARTADLVDFPITLPGGTAGLSVANTIITPSDISVSQAVLTGTLGDGTLGGAAGSTNYFTSQYSGGTALAVNNGTGTPTSYGFGSALTGTHRYSIFHTGALLNGCVDGVCAAGSAGVFAVPVFTRFRVGMFAIANNNMGGITKYVCIDGRSGQGCL